MLERMRIDPKSMIGGCPALVVRKALRHLRVWDQWSVTDLEAAAALAPGTGGDLVKALQAERLIEFSAAGAWSVTQAGCTFSVATAAKAVTRVTAERALSQFVGRVDHVNRSAGFLGKVVAVVLFGSMLKPEVEHVSDVDLAVEIVPKEANPERARARNERHVLELESLGHRLRGFLARQLFWYWEVFRYLKGGTRVISLADLKAEGEFVLAAPHRILYAEGEWAPDAPPRAKVARRRTREPVDDSLF
jgi:hypothetical protein